MSCSAREGSCCARSSRSSPVTAATLQHCCSRPPSDSSRSMCELARETYLNALAALILAGRAISTGRWGDRGRASGAGGASGDGPASGTGSDARRTRGSIPRWTYCGGPDPDAGASRIGRGRLRGGGAPLVVLGVLRCSAALGLRHVARALRAVRRTWPPGRCAERDPATRSCRAHTCICSAASWTSQRP